jgi:hypothetical protein
VQLYLYGYGHGLRVTDSDSEIEHGLGTGFTVHCVHYKKLDMGRERERERDPDLGKTVLPAASTYMVVLNYRSINGWSLTVDIFIN